MKKQTNQPPIRREREARFKQALKMERRVLLRRGWTALVESRLACQRDLDAAAGVYRGNLAWAVLGAWRRALDASVQERQRKELEELEAASTVRTRRVVEAAFRHWRNRFAEIADARRRELEEEEEIEAMLGVAREWINEYRQNKVFINDE